MEAKVIQIGNSLGVRIPLTELKRLEKGKDDIVNIKILTRKELIEEEKNEKNVSASGMSKELTSLIVHDSDNGDRGFNLNEAGGFLRMGSRNVNRIIGEGLTHNWLIRQVRGREVFYDASINGKSEAYSVLNVGSSAMKSVEICINCGVPFNKIRHKECPVCDREKKDRQRVKDLEVTESEFINCLRSELEVHKSPVEGNPVLDECRSLAVLEDSDLPKGIVLPERKSVPSCVVERYAVEGETIPRADALNKGYYSDLEVKKRNRELIAAFKVDLLNKCPPQQHAEYNAICEIIFINDCSLANQEYWTERAGVQIRRNSKILPGLRSKFEKIEYLKTESSKIAANFLKFKEEADKNKRRGT